MKISSKGRYALRIMIDLAMHNTEGYVSMASISSRQDVSAKYLEQVVSLLTKAGYVISVRGASGGYRLAFSPEKYTVAMILSAAEGPLAVAPCLEPGYICTRKEHCESISVWEKVNKAVYEVIENITLADVIREHQEKSGSYVI